VPSMVGGMSQQLTGVLSFDRPAALRPDLQISSLIFGGLPKKRLHICENPWDLLRFLFYLGTFPRKGRRSSEP
jgi:hypothetical protein